MKVQLPPISGLRRRCQSLAALDLILSPAWEYRYFSFNSRWSPGQQMGSMRNGCGDEWFCLFHQDGWARLKGLAHESEAWRSSGPELSSAIQRAVPQALAEFSTEPAFRWDATTFGFCTMGEAEPWVRLNDLTEFWALRSGEAEFLELLVAAPDGYIRFASGYFEVEIALDSVRTVFEHGRIDSSLVTRINPQIDLNTIAEELFTEIGYPR